MRSADERACGSRGKSDWHLAVGVDSQLFVQRGPDRLGDAALDLSAALHAEAQTIRV